MIPKIIHFICIKPMRFSFIHYLAVMSAKEKITPDIIYMYYDSHQEDNIYWEIIKKYVVFEQIDPPKIFRGKPIKYPQYMADIIRLEKLLKYGGIYLDLDILTLKSFDNFLLNNCVLTARPSAAVNDHSKLEETQNSIIMTAPNHPFIQKWYDVLDKYIGEGYEWSYHAVCLPPIILKEDKYDVTLLDCDGNFMPFLWDIDNPYIFDDSQNEKISHLDNYYTIMFFQTLVFDKYLKKLDPGYFLNHNNLFTLKFGEYVHEVSNNKDLIVKFIWKNYHQKEWNMIIELGCLYKNMVMDNAIVDYQYVMFFMALAYFHTKKITRSIEFYNELLNNPKLDNSLKSWIPHNLSLSQKYISDRKQVLLKEAKLAYSSNNWELLDKKCEEYGNLMIESNYDYQHILFFSAFTNRKLNNVDKSKMIYNKLLSVSDLHEDVKVWALHNNNV